MSSSGRATSRLNHPAPQAAGPLEHGFRRVLPLTETAIRGLALSPSRREAPARAVPATQPSVQQCSGTEWHCSASARGRQRPGGGGDRGVSLSRAVGRSQPAARQQAGAMDSLMLLCSCCSAVRPAVPARAAARQCRCRWVSRAASTLRSASCG